MNITVFGGNGFIGSHVVDLLLKAQHTVTVFGRSHERFRSPLPGVRYVLGDFDDEEKIAKALQHTEVVLHLITSTIPQTSNEEPVYDIQSNLINTVKLLNQCVASGVKKVVYLSSGGTVYGIPTTYPVTESHETNPICSYGIVKLAVEKYLHLYHHLYNLNYVVLRASNPYGERQDPSGRQGVISVFLGRALRHLPVTLWGDGNVVRDYVYVKDLARACVLSAHPDIKNTILNIGSSQGTSLNEILDIIQDITGDNIQIERKAPRALDVPKLILDAHRASEQLNWVAETSLEEGIAQSWEWLKLQESILQN
jgi:UDP-glucose 4-epimerase